MAYEGYALALSGLSSLVLLAGLYHTFYLERKTSKASVLWSLLLFGFFTLWVYQFAEVLEYTDHLYLHQEGSSPAWVHTAFEEATGISLGAFGEELAHTMPGISAAIFLCAVLVIRRSVIVPI